MRILICVLFCFYACLAQAQQYRFHQYRVEQGLPSDVVKGINQDSLGFFWIATDDGLVKYDGVHFTTYKSAFRSQYTKGFLRTRSGRLFAYGDLELIEIHNQIDTVFFSVALPGSRSFSDSAIWYPKGAYEDVKGNIWLAEPKSVVKMVGKSFKRYDFGEANRSPVFIRSFSFFEDNFHNLYVISYMGNAFRYDASADAFVPVDVKLPAHIAQTLYFQNRLLLASRDGLYTATVSGGQIKHVSNIFPIREVSNLLQESDTTALVTTFGEDLYRIHFQDDFSWENLYYNFKSINSCYVSYEGDIWSATDKGLILTQRNLFTLADINSQANFIEGMTYDERRQAMYYCDKETLVELRPHGTGEWERTVIYENKNGYCQCLQSGAAGLWMSSGADVYAFKDNKLVRQWNFQQDGNFVHDIYLDQQQQLWLTQSGTSDIKMLTPDLRLERYALHHPEGRETNLIREGPLGLYAASSGLRAYLFFKSPGDREFRNVSLPLPFVSKSDFNILDMAPQHHALWIASTEGLLYYDHHQIQRIDLGELFTELSVSSVEKLDDENILFSNSHGLFRYNTVTGEYWLFDENAGLPSNTITDHGITVTQQKQVWVGTSYGIAEATRSITDYKPTPRPYCVAARVNGELRRYLHGLRAPYGAFINLQFSPITFPENKIQIQWMMDIPGDTVWHTLAERQLNLSDLKPGTHHLLVRAKKNTGLGWSEPLPLTIYVETPYWRRAEFVFLVLLSVLIIAWVSYAVTSLLARKRRAYLQQLIYERTLELQKANTELTQRNNELDRFVYSASHDLSAPLKSILGLIAVARLDQPTPNHTQYLSMMERSVLKLEEFIQEVVSYSRNARMPVKLEALDFKTFVKELLEVHLYAPNFSRISFSVDDRDGQPIVTDATRLKIILNNLLSNAIKFHWVEGREQPYVRIALSVDGGHYVIVVEDNGRGIEEKHLKHIFDMFYRATEETPGSGLGLYILKEAVLKLDGTVDAHSRLEEGTRFVIRIPIPTNAETS